MATLPGTGPLPPKPTAPLTTPTDPMSKAATEAMWKGMAGAPPALADVILQFDALLKAHPELLEWAKAGRVNPTPGAVP